MSTVDEGGLSQLIDILDGSRIRRNGDTAIYLVEVTPGPVDPIRTRRHIPNPDTYNNLFRSWDGIRVLSPLDFDTTQPGAGLPDGAALVRSDDGSPPVYLLDNGNKREIRDPISFDAYWFDPGRVVTVPALLLDLIPRGPIVGR